MTRYYRFGDFRLAPATRELWREGIPVAVPPRAFDCIVYLIEHRERAVGRDELIAAVWGKTDISEGMLGQTVLAMRRAVDDTGKDQQVIRTVFRFGYHWVADTERSESDDASVTTMPVATPQSSASERTGDGSPIESDPYQAPRTMPSATRRRPWVIALALVAAIGAMAWVFVLPRSREPGVAGSAQPISPKPAIIAAVLPFSISAGPGYDWMRLGLMDLVGARLRSAGLAMVPSDNIVALGKGHTIDAQTLAQTTGASIVIQAKVELSGSRWHVSLRTIRGREPPLVAVGDSADALEAARNAADSMARQLGFAALVEPPASVDDSAIAPLSQQIEAAILIDDIATARSLIGSLSSEQREYPEIQLRLAQIDYQSGDFDAAESRFLAVVENVPSEQDGVLHARALSNLGAIAAQRGNPALAIRRYDDAIELLRGEAAIDALGRALLGRAMTLGSSGRYDEALQGFAEARGALERSGNVLALAVLDANLGALDLLRLRYAEAVPVFERAANRFATFRLHAAELNARAAAAELKLALLEPEAALGMLARIHELIGQVADPARQRSGALTCVQILIANGRLREAAEMLQPTLASAVEAQDRAAIAHGHALAAQLALASGDFRAAAHESEAALPHFNDSEDARERSLTWRLHIVALIALGEHSAASASLDAFSKQVDSASAAPVRMYLHLAEADVAAALKATETGEKYQRAVAEADALHIPLDLRDAVQAYAGWLLVEGRLDQASAMVERLAAWAATDYESARLRLRIQHQLGDTIRWSSTLNEVRAIAGERELATELTVAPTRR